MRLRAAIAFVALATPIFAQRGGGHGSAGHAGGFSASRSFAPSGSFARPAPPARYGPRAGYRPSAPPNYSGVRVPYGARAIGAPTYSAYRNPYTVTRSSAFRPPYVPAGVAASSARNRGPIDPRRRFNNGWVYNNYAYPPYLASPYLIDPGFYDWSEPYDSGYDQGVAAPPYPGSYPEYPVSYPDEGYPAPGEPPVAFASGSMPAPLPGQPLTVIFKSDRAPVKMQNYMMTAKVLTDLDDQHYEQIPMDEIDVTATQRANGAAGVEFQVPGAAGN